MPRSLLKLVNMTEKILFVIADSSQTGAPTQVLYLLRGLESKYKKVLICPEGWLAVEAEKAGAQVHTLPFELSRWQMRKYLAAKYTEISPKIIHFHGVRAGVMGCLVDIPQGVKTVYTEHLWTRDFHLPNRWREWLQLALLKSVCKKVDLVIAVSDATKKFLINKKIVKKNKVAIIYGAIEPIKAISTVNTPVIGTIGRLTWIKGVDQIIRALPKIKQSIPNIRCVIAGDGPDRLKLRNLAKHFKVADSVVWLTEVKHREKFYQSLKVYIQPSLSESFGMAPLEAQSAGVPVIVSNAGALPEVVQHGKTGLVFKKNDIKGLADCVSTLLANQELMEKLRVLGKKEVEKFSEKRLADEHVKWYEKLI